MSPKCSRSLFFTLIIAAVGCGTAPADPPDSAAALDAGGMEHDAGSLTDAAMPELCPTEGALRTASCGMCGLVSQACRGGAWTDVSACLMEGACREGSVETRATLGCGEETRICMASCQWSDWSRTAPDAGECVAGETRRSSSSCPTGLTRDQLCSDTCEWADAGDCLDECGGTPRLSPEWAREVCVPAGPFIRGEPTASPTSPQPWEPETEITLSAYYIDVFPVTNRRYRECVDAEVCDPPYGPEALAWHLDPARADHPAQGIAFDDAVAFCTWDGRRLPTEAEWEKAIRGPAPRRAIYPWDGDTFDCARIYSAPCGYVESVRQQIPDRYDGLPGSRGFYGTEMQLGGGTEWVSDWYSHAAYREPGAPTVDPTGPAPIPDGRHTVRGIPRSLFDDSRNHLTYRSGGSEPPGRYPVVRCARRIE